MKRLPHLFAVSVLCFFGAVPFAHADLKDLLKPVPGAQSEREPVRTRPTSGASAGSSAEGLKEESAEKKEGAAGSKNGVKTDGTLREITELEVAEAVQKDLLRRFPSLGDLKVNLSRPWKPLALPAGDFFAECLQLPGNGLSSNMSFSVRIVSGGRILGEFPMQARVELWQEVWVSSQRLDKGQVLDRGMLNTVKLDVLREYVPPLTVDQDYLGFELSQPLQPGRPLTRRDIVERTVVKRGQIVEAVATEGSIKIRMRAQALENGPAGAMIRVKNVDSQKEFVAQVLNENQVQVRF
jgi:flagella basal body P-ring formation protein FlgA